MTAENAVLQNLKPLVACLIHNFLTGEYEQRRESAIALSKFKGEKCTDFLLETYESDNIQDFMALALGNIDSSKAVGLLINALKDSQQEVRFNAAQALGMLENPEALDILMEALNNYADSSSGAEKQPTGDDPGSQIFFEEDAIISAILAVGKIKNWRAIALLKKLLAQEKSARIRASIIMALGMMSSDKLMPVFQAALRDEDPRVRANAIESIESIKSGSIVGIIQPYLEDPSNRVRANVAKAIWKYGDFDVSDTLKQMLEHKDKWYRASSAYAIGEIRDARFIRELSKALKDEDPDVRRNATNALRKLEVKDAFPHLKPMIDDPNFDVRVEAALAITRCAPDKATEIMKHKLQNEENFIVQATLISCLGQSGQPEMMPLIRPFLQSEDPRVVSNTIDAMVKLSRTADPEIVKSLKQLLSHEDNRVKSTAIRTLWVWGEYEVLDNLKALLKATERKLVKSATFVLGEIGVEISHDDNLRNEVNKILTDLIDNPQSISELRNSIKDEPDRQQTEAPSDSQTTQQPSEIKTEIELPEAQPPEECISNEIAAEPVVAEAGKNAEEPVIVKQILPESTYVEELEQANQLIGLQKYAEAEAIFKKILAEAPEHLKALTAYANLCFLQKHYSDAARLYQLCLQQNPNLVKAHYNLGTIFYNARRYEDAVRHLGRALSLYPKILGAYLILAQIYQIAGKLQESVKLLHHAAALSPRNPIIYQKLAAILIQLRQYDNAIEVLQKAVSIAPLDVESNLLLAYCFNLTQQPQQAFSAMDLTLRSCVQSPNQDGAMRQVLKAYLFLNSMLQEQLPTEAINDA